MKRFCHLFAVAVVTITLAGCGENSSQPKVDPTTTPGGAKTNSGGAAPPPPPPPPLPGKG